MFSAYMIITIMCIIFWILILLRKGCYMPNFSIFNFFTLYFTARVIPVAALPDKSLETWFCMAVELFMVFVLYFYIRHEKSDSLHGLIISLYLFSPLPILSILNGKMNGLCITMFFLTLLCFFDIFESKRNKSLVRFIPEYIMLGVGILGLFASTELLGQSFSDIKNNNSPIFYIVSALIIFLAIGMGILRVVKKKDSPISFTPVIDFSYEIKNSSLTIKDIFLISLFTFLFASVVLFRLGNPNSPETYYDMQADQDEKDQIILHFGDEVSISNVYIYLGYNTKREMSFSSLIENDLEWNTFLDRYLMENEFQWNRITMNRSVTSLGMKLTEGSAYIHEIVCLDPDGNLLLPINAQDYSALFDEQDLFPDTQTYYDQIIFDEVYYPRTAYEFIHHLSIYEDTHPPLGKTIISIGIHIFGMNPFGWRIMCAVFGILMVPLTYLFAHKMFGKTKYACCTTILLCTQFMNFTLSRIATIDILVAFFILLMFFFMYGYLHSLNNSGSFRKQMLWLLLAGISTGLAIATKWTGFYACAGIAVLFFIGFTKYINGWKNAGKYKKHIIKTGLWCIICFIMIPITIYIVSYLPFTKIYTDKNLLEAAISNSIFMLTYHSSAFFYHPYSSAWYEWLIDKRPLLDIYCVMPDGKISEIATFINPLICWGGIISFVHQIYLWMYQKCRNAQFLTLAWCSVVVPWFFIHRTVFIYQYFLGSILLIFMIVNSIAHFRKNEHCIFVVSLVSIMLFVMFYPVLSGMPVSSDYISKFLKWLPTWPFIL